MHRILDKSHSMLSPFSTRFFASKLEVEEARDVP